MSQKIAVTLLGSTGSIGVSALDVLSRHNTKYQVVALTANNNVDKMLQQCRDFNPNFAVMRQADAADKLQQLLHVENIQTVVLSGIAGLQQVASMDLTDTVVAGIVGAAGLLPTLAAVEKGKKVLLANKEALVMTGQLLLQSAAVSGAVLLPVDSEHNAIFQCMPQTSTGIHHGGVKKILLTASGGPFRCWTQQQMAKATPEQALAHPNWVMGRKISIDSASLMNKGLEVIEACLLFDMPASRVEVVVHPESVIHSMVSYADGSVLAQMGRPDMRTPIAHALAWPERIDSGVAPLDLIEFGRLNFEHPDTEQFPCLGLAYQVMEQGGTAPTVLNAANEVAVEQFLSRQIGFMQIPQVIEKVLEMTTVQSVETLQQVLDADVLARANAEHVIRDML